MLGDGLAPGLLPAIDHADIDVAPSYVDRANLLVADNVCVCSYALKVGLNFACVYVGRLAAIATWLRILRREGAEDCEKGRTRKKTTPHSVHPLLEIQAMAVRFQSKEKFQAHLANARIARAGHVTKQAAVEVPVWIIELR